MRVHRAPSTSAPRALRAEFPQVHHCSLPAPPVSEPGNPPHTERISNNLIVGQETRGALAPTSGVATCSMTTLMPGRYREETSSRLPRGRRMSGVTSGAGTLTRPVSPQGGPGDSPTVRDRGVSEAAHPQYSRAGKVREREQGPSLFTTLTLPPLPFCPSDPVSLFVCGACESVCVCAALRLPRCVSTGPVAVRLAVMAI